MLVFGGVYLYIVWKKEIPALPGWIKNSSCFGKRADLSAFYALDVGTWMLQQVRMNSLLLAISAVIDRV